jgi:hypothetical protein
MMGKMRSGLLSLGGFVFALCLAGTPALWAQGQPEVSVVEADRHAVAPPLSQMKPIPPASTGDDDDDDIEPGHSPHPRFAVNDSVVQHSSETLEESAVAGLSHVSIDAAATRHLTTNSELNILGMGNGFPNFTIGMSANVPDTNGAAGATQYVQFVNEAFVVLNKSTGAIEYGPAKSNTLWQALGGSCASEPNMDAVAQYDKIANVWVMMMPAWTTPPEVCVAVSTTSDATNSSWNLYQFLPPVNPSCHCRPMFDYPKIAVWPDGYYLSWNEIFDNNFIGAQACVVNRSAMIAGNAATMQCFSNTSSTAGSLLPADLDGTTLPPSGSPEYFLNFDTNDQQLDLWEFSTNWSTPSLSTFTGPTVIPVAAFTEACGETLVEFTYTTGDCIPQTGTSISLDSYGDRIMYRLAYRNFGGYQAIVTNHTVQVSTSSNQTGLRWYELQNTGSGFGLYQQGTYAPDSTYRWMGSIAMDHVGDIAMGYSASNASMGPSIRYTGRVPTDTLGTMESEVDVLTAAGITPASRTNNYRWADYSSIAVDPIDDCTFWYTTQYMAVSGGFWSTRIASFNFPGCIGSSVLTVDESGQGTVTSADGEINCTNGSGSCSATYSSGASVTLTATPASNYVFSGWSGACSGANPCSLTMSTNLTATAAFVPSGVNYTLTVNETGQGTVTSADGEINCTSGTGTCSATYASGTAVTLSATAASGSTFTGWSGACSGRRSCALTMNSNLTANATFVTTPAWAIVQKTAKAGAITNITIPATGAGHLIAVALIFNGTTSVSSVTDNAGNTYVSAHVPCAYKTTTADIWYAESSVAGATTITPTFVGSPTQVQIAVWEVSGVLNMSLDATGTATGSITLNNTPGPAVTTTMNGDFILSIMLAMNSSFSAISTGNAFTNDFKTYGNGWAHITSNSTSPGTQQASWYTATPSGAYCSNAVAFAP